jgi:hypothetical protein
MSRDAVLNLATIQFIPTKFRDTGTSELNVKKQAVGHYLFSPESAPR